MLRTGRRECLSAILSVLLLATGTSGYALAGEPPLVFLSTVPEMERFDRVLDTRAVGLCSKSSVAGARCLSPGEILGPHRRFPSISGLLWLLGSAGLNGGERVLVIGDDRTSRDFVAGLLYLTGQAQVVVLDERITGGRLSLSGRGQLHSSLRERVYTAPIRADRILLRSELLRLLRSATPPVLLDGRSEAEYWGARVRGSRGGHLPGAQYFAVSSVRELAASGVEFPQLGGDPVAYAHDSYEGLAYLARLVAGGINTRLYLEGWSGWASDGSLPIDSPSYPEAVAKDERSTASLTDAVAEENGLSVTTLLVAAGGFGLGGFLLGRLTVRGGSV